MNSFLRVSSPIRPVTFREGYSRLKPGLSQATIRYPKKTQNSGIWIEKDGYEKPSANQWVSPHSIRRISPEEVGGSSGGAREEHARRREGGGYADGRLPPLSLHGRNGRDNGPQH